MKYFLFILFFLAIGYYEDPMEDGSSCTREDFVVYKSNDFEREVAGIWTCKADRLNGNKFEATLELKLKKKYSEYNYKMYDSMTNQNLSYSGTWTGKDNNVKLDNGNTFHYVDGKLISFDNNIYIRK